MLAALTFLDKGGVMEEPKAWLCTVMNRKYYDSLRRKYQLSTVTIGDDFDIADDVDTISDIIRREEAENVRREVAYLAETYRIIIARHYFHGESIADIAKDLKMPEGTVKSRLDFGRKQLKKGFENMKNYTENSYMPQNLVVRNSGRCGLNDEPMSIVDWDNTLEQNLLILAYDKLVADYAEAYCGPLKEAIQKLKETDFYSERLERYMLINIADAALWKSLQSHRKPQVFPERPNGGRWIAFGTIIPDNYTIPNARRGKEEYGMSGQRSTKIEQYLEALNIEMYNYETSLYDKPKHSGYDFNTFQEVENNMLKLFYLISKGISPKVVDADQRIIKAMPLLEERGFIEMKDGEPKLLIPCLTHAEADVFWKICREASNTAAKELEEPMAEYIKTHKKTIPAHLKSVPDQKLTMPYEPGVMMFVYEAINRGLHRRYLGYPCPETIVVFD